MTSPIVIQTVDATAAAAITALQNSIFDQPWSTSSIARLLTPPFGGGLIASVNTSASAGLCPVGYCISQDAGESIDILSIGVLSAHRRAGIGRTLLHHIIQQAQDRGYKRVLLDVNVSNRAAIALYEHFGFSIVTKRARYYGTQNGDAVVLARNLTD